MTRNCSILRNITLQTDISSMASAFSRGDAQQNAFLNFASSWPSLSLSLIGAKAVFINVSGAALSSQHWISFKSDFSSTPRLRITAMLYSIGDSLEKKASEYMETNIMLGLMLDVAGSIALLELRRRVIDVAISEAHADGLAIIDDITPGSGGDGMEIHLIPEIEEAMSHIGMSANRFGVLTPQKSGSRIFILGVGEDRIKLTDEPCKPCEGDKCPYRQFGGCHLLSEL